MGGRGSKKASHTEEARKALDEFGEDYKDYSWNKTVIAVMGGKEPVGKTSFCARKGKKVTQLRTPEGGPIRMRGRNYNYYESEVFGENYTLIDVPYEPQEAHYTLHHLVGVSGGFVILYNINSRISFTDAESLANDVWHAAKQHHRDPIILMVGTQNDTNPNKRRILEMEGRNMAEEYGCGFEEGSAVKKDDVGMLLNRLVEQMEMGRPFCVNAHVANIKPAKR